MIKVDYNLLTEFENGLNPAYPERSGIRPRILGYGEISTTFSIPGMPGVAFKRMPPFDGNSQIIAYKKAVNTYCSLLRNKCGIETAAFDIYDLTNCHGEHIVYVAQSELPEESIGNYILRKENLSQIESILDIVIERLFTLHEYNQRAFPAELIGFDAQISNWSFSFSHGDECIPLYIDITTPLFRFNGSEQLDPEIFLKSCPSFLIWLVRWQFLQEVLDRYYDIRLIMIDLVSNFYKEGLPDLIDKALTRINQRIRITGLVSEINPLTRPEIDRYYKNDAFIWSLFLRLRRFDRIIKTKLLKKRYNFILPGKVNR